ncbi:lamina-associated polypeptide 2, isoforms alpha/zeta-like [Hyperolius riggenbachi]|uniref:lamina-associated polypeptide 2, isoforms alpha/zeta-like n=1 Tax=Hyperolius riggenbachi TaxID=752182 RepID=UPI0035A2C5DA
MEAAGGSSSQGSVETSSVPSLPKMERSDSKSGSRQDKADKPDKPDKPDKTDKTTPHAGSKATHKSGKKCAICGNYMSSSSKVLCQDCTKKVVREETPTMLKELKGWIRSEISSAVQTIKVPEVAVSNVQMPSVPAAVSAAPAVSDIPGPSGSVPIGDPTLKRKRKEDDSEDSEMSEGELDISSLEEIPSETEKSAEKTVKNQKFAFSTDFMKELLAAMHEAMGITIEQKTLSPLDQMYETLSEPQVTFIPVHSSLKGIIRKEWDNPDRRAFWPKSLNKRYPYSPEDQRFWGTAPKLDPSLSKVSRRSDLQFEDFGSLKDPIDKKMDNILRRAWEAASLNFKPSIASTAVARSLKIWLVEVQSQIASGVSREELLNFFPKILHATNYLSDAADDSVRLTARTTALVNSARRGIWVKTWQGDTSSKSKLCSIPCEGGLLFGTKLEETLERSADKKKNFPYKRKIFRPNRSFRVSGKSEQENKGNQRRRWIPNKSQRSKPSTPYTSTGQPTKQ